MAEDTLDLYKDFITSDILEVCEQEKYKLRPASEAKIGDIVVCTNRENFAEPTDIGKVLYVAPKGVRKYINVLC